MYITIRHELCHARKAWPGIRVDPCLLSGFDYKTSWSIFCIFGTPCIHRGTQNVPLLTYSRLCINKSSTSEINKRYIDQSRTRVIGAIIFIEAVNIYRVLNVWYYTCSYLLPSSDRKVIGYTEATIKYIGLKNTTWKW